MNPPHKPFSVFFISLIKELSDPQHEPMKFAPAWISSGTNRAKSLAVVLYTTCPSILSG